MTSQNRTTRSLHAETIRAAWAAGDATIAQAKAVCIAADQRAAALRAMRAPAATPKRPAFLRLFWTA